MPSEHAAKLVNDRYYAQILAGRDDYWKKMAGPRYRLAVLIGELRREPLASLVDLGCGNGVLLREICRHFSRLRLAGIDLSDDQVAANRREYPDIDWRAHDLDAAAALDSRLSESFDVVVASEIIEHLSSPLRFLQNARRLAAPGGRLLLSTQSGPIHETERRVGHRRHFSAEEMSRLLESAGWAPERVWNSGFPFHDLSKWLANLSPERTMKSFSAEAYGWPQKLVCWGLRAAFALNSSTRGNQLFAVARHRVAP